MVELIEVVTISVNNPQIVAFHQLGFDHADDFFTFIAIAVYKVDSIPKGIASTYFGHRLRLVKGLVECL
jgi:hypothetical protein